MIKNNKIKYIFIDTNIYLDYFRMSSETITSLAELYDLLYQKKLKLILPKQVRDEYLRIDKEKMIDREKSQLGEQIKKQIKVQLLGSLKLPQKINHLKEVKKIEKCYSELKCVSDKFENISKELLERCNSELEERRKNKTKVEKLIKDIFKKADFKPAEEDNVLIQKAFHRYLKGNPPGDPLVKNQEEYGDAIIWEFLLDKFNKKENKENIELVIITKDGGWYENTTGNINKFLVEEWKEKTKKQIKISNSLGDFINIITKKITIKKEVIKEEKSQIEYYPSFFDTATRVSDPFLDSSRYVSSPLMSSVLSSGLISNPNYAASYIFNSKNIKYCCPKCQEDITTDLKKRFPGLETVSVPSIDMLSNLGSIGAQGLYGLEAFRPGLGGIFNIEKINCPKCKAEFNLNEVEKKYY